MLVVIQVGGGDVDMELIYVNAMTLEVNSAFYIFYRAHLSKVALHWCITFTHSHTRSHTDGGGNHARHQPAHRVQLVVHSLRLKDSSTCIQGEPGFEPPTQWTIGQPALPPEPQPS